MNPVPRFFALVAIAAAAATLAGTPSAQAQTTAPKSAPRQLNLESKPWKGDFDEMLSRRMIRVLVPYSRTLYYSDKGRERGITAELLRDMEKQINKRYIKELGKRPLTVYIIATTRDKLFSGVAEGHGDIAMGNLTVTEERKKLVDFVTAADVKPVRELIVSGPKSPQVATVDDLSGKTVHVRPSTSYAESLAALNQRLKSAGKPPVNIVALPDALEDEDKLEMLNAGLIELVVVDDWKARIWAKVLPKIKVREDLVLRDGGVLGAAVRKDSPKLQAALREAYAGAVKTQGDSTRRQARTLQRVKQIKNNANGDEMKRFQASVALFEKYGQKYRFDPLMLAAQGYQESQLNQAAKSPVGAIGVMQLMPATGAELRVGDIHTIEPNIHGGAKYMDQLMTRYFGDAKFSEANRPLFAFAAYNCGPGNIAKMRKEAEKRGLDPDKWFNNVEIVTAEKIGIETTTYVRNIYKYYTAYKLIEDAQARQAAALKQVVPGAK